MITYDYIAKNKRNSVLLIFIFLILIIALGWVFSHAYGNPGILFFAVIFSTVSAVISYFFSDSITLAISQAKEVDRQSAPELYRMVENLTIAAGLPMPRVYIIEDTAMNAFATGRDPKHGVICFSTGIIQRLEKNELEGVTAHELSHIGNYDIRFMTLVVVLVGILTLLADWMLRASFFGGNRRRDNEGGNLFALIGLILAILSPIIATLIKLAVSRQREYLADSSAALLTRYPDGLARALEKISHDREPLEAANKATAHLYIADPFHSDSAMKTAENDPEQRNSRNWLASLFNTHPPIEDRIKRLREMNV
jgi:heat shock protein HtpX